MLDLIGSSVTFRALLEKVDMVAPVDSAVLIQGEDGHGQGSDCTSDSRGQSAAQEPFRGSQLRSHSEYAARE